MLERRIQTLIYLIKMQFGFMPREETGNAIFIVRWMQEDYQKNEKKLYICFVGTEKQFDRVPQKVMVWAMRKKALLEITV